MIYIRRYKSRNNLKKYIYRRTRWIKRKETRNKIRYNIYCNQHLDHKSHPINQSNQFNQPPQPPQPPTQHPQSQCRNNQPRPPPPPTNHHIQPHPRCRNYYIQKGYEPNIYEHQLMSKQYNQKYRRWAAHNPNNHKYMNPY